MSTAIENLYTQLGGIHIHCVSCYSSIFCSMLDDACDFLNCPQNCSQVLHSCKLPEHIDEVCPNSSVPCLNSQYGCKKILLRKNLGVHLETCQASLIICSSKWYRTPAWLKTRKFYKSNSLPKAGLLDYDLAMRDQRLLLNYKVRHKPDHYLLNRTEGAELSKQILAWDIDLKKRLAGKKLPPNYWDYPEIEKGGIHKEHCSRCFNLNCDVTNKLDSTLFCPFGPCKFNCGAVFHSCKSSEHYLLCPNYKETDANAWMYRGLSRETEFLLNFVEKETTSKEIANYQTDRGQKEIKSNSKGYQSIPNPPPLPPSPEFWLPLRVNVGLEDYVGGLKRIFFKKRLYSFSCNSVQRRDQIQWHYQNFHNELELDCSWVEHRCPLSYLGCPFSVRRLNPKNFGDSIHFSSYHESFGVRNKSKYLTSDGSISLLNLPVELTVLILSHLDSFSLHSLKGTCLKLKNIVDFYFLESKGCVSPVWTKVNSGWKISSFRHFFSKAVHPISRWKLEESGKMAAHLKSCIYYVPNSHTSKAQITASDQNLWNKVFKQLVDCRKTR